MRIPGLFQFVTILSLLISGAWLHAEAHPDYASEDAADALYQLGSERYLTGDMIGSRVAFRAGCEDGRLEACHMYGLMLYRGEGGAREEDAARDVFANACSARFARACVLSARMHEKGDGGPVDIPRAIRAYDFACQQERFEACHAYGALLREGREEMSENHPHARTLFSRACFGGYARACLSLGEMQAEGEGGAMMLNAARGAYRLGCEGAHAESCMALADAFAAGVGGVENRPAARAARRQACLYGYTQACTSRFGQAQN